MSTEPQRPMSRITEALLPPEPATPPPHRPLSAPAGPRTDHAAPAAPDAPTPPAPRTSSPAAASPRPDAPTPPAPGPRATFPAAGSARPGASAPPAPEPRTSSPAAASPRPDAPTPSTPPGLAVSSPTPERPALREPAPRTERPVSRITEALLPPEPPAPAAPVASAPPASPAARPAGDGRPRRVAQPLPPEQPAPSARPVRPAPGAETPTETTTRLRPVRDDRQGPVGAAAPRHGTPPHPAPARPAGPGAVRGGHPTPAGPPPGGAPRPAPAYAYDPWALGGGAPAETPVETTTRLRPIRERGTGRVVAAAVCAVLALGLVGGALTGAVLAGTGAGEPAEPPGFSRARALWHDAPVDTLFPRTLSGPDAGPGGATRTWSRIVVAPDAPCTPAALPRALHTALGAVGCDRVLRATYTDATSSHVVTVALVFTQADPATMRTLGSRAADEPAPALSAPGTVAARFGDRQRASWWRHVLPDLPVVVTAVSGFADGRVVAEPEAAERAMKPKRTTAVAQAGLGHEAKGAAEAVERALRATVAAAVEEDKR